MNSRRSRRSSSQHPKRPRRYSPEYNARPRSPDLFVLDALLGLDDIDSLLEQASEVLKQQPSQPSKPSLISLDLDALVEESKHISKPKSLSFFQPGSISTQLSSEREQSTLEKALSLGYDVAKVDKSKVQSKAWSDYLSSILNPPINWWDKTFLPQCETFPQDISPYIDTSPITNTLPLPFPLESSGKDTKEVPHYLTKKERRVERKKARQERAEEQQKLVLLGLADPEKQRITLHNRSLVESAKAVHNPTLTAMAALADIQERKLVHHERNAAQQLSKEEKKEKRKEKVKKDALATEAVEAVVYKLKDFDDGHNRFKVVAKAHEWWVSGVGMTIESDIEGVCNLVFIYAEGGLKGMRKFKNLVENKIQWGEGKNPVQVWEGKLNHRLFGKFLPVKFDSFLIAKEFCIKNNAGFVYDAVKGFSES
ncbi:hypothetical protein GEMRC1_001911 [Eukaryota sp. GEM-RC1]